MMSFDEIIPLFQLEKEGLTEELKQALQKLDHIPHTFSALSWHPSHDYLWISRNVEKIIGHSHSKFVNKGIMFIFTITPQKLIPVIVHDMEKGLAPLKQDIGNLKKPVIMRIQGGITHLNGQDVDIVGRVLVLDYLPGPETRYLVLTVHIAREYAGSDFDDVVKSVCQTLVQIHKLYVAMKPERFNALYAFLNLTNRESEIAELLRNGYNSKEIADKLNIAHGTATSHRKNILKKLGVRNTAEMVQLMNKFLV